MLKNYHMLHMREAKLKKKKAKDYWKYLFRESKELSSSLTPLTTLYGVKKSNFCSWE